MLLLPTLLRVSKEKKNGDLVFEEARLTSLKVRRPKIPRPPAPAPAPNWEQPMMAMQGVQQASVMPMPHPQWNPQPAATPSATPLPITVPQSPATPQLSATPRLSATPQPSQSMSTPHTGPQPGIVETPLLPNHLPLATPIDPLKTVVLITGMSTLPASSHRPVKICSRSCHI